MGTIPIASGRRPSMDRITTRAAWTAGVGAAVAVSVCVAAGVNVGTGVSVSTGVAEAATVTVGAGTGSPPRLGNWHARRMTIEKTDRNIFCVRLRGIGTDSLSRRFSRRMAAGGCRIDLGCGKRQTDHLETPFGEENIFIRGKDQELEGYTERHCLTGAGDSI